MKTNWQKLNLVFFYINGRLASEGGGGWGRSFHPYFLLIRFPIYICRSYPCWSTLLVVVRGPDLLCLVFPAPHPGLSVFYTYILSMINLNTFLLVSCGGSAPSYTCSFLYFMLMGLSQSCISLD